MQHQDVSSLLHELSALCQEARAAEAFQYLVAEGAQLLRVQSVGSVAVPDSEKRSSVDRDLVLSCLSQARGAPSPSSTFASLGPASTNKTVSQKLFTPLQRIITEVEVDAVLSRQLQNLLQLRGSSIGNIGGVEQAQKLSKADRRKSVGKLSQAVLCDYLSQFLENITSKNEGGGEEHDLRTHLVIMKLLLCLLESQEEGAIDNHHMRLSLTTCRFLSIPDNLSKFHIEKCLYREKERARLSTFLATPRVLIHSGSNSAKVSNLEVQGPSLGVISGISVRAPDGERYFEVTLKGSPAKSNGFVRIGWAVTGADFGSFASGHELGDLDNCIVFEGYSGFMFHNAQELRTLDTAAEEAAVHSQSPTTPFEVSQVDSGNLQRYGQLLSIGVEKSLVLKMMLLHGTSPEIAESFLESIINLEKASTDEYDDNLTGVAVLLGQKKNNSIFSKSPTAIAVMKEAASRGGIFLQDSDTYHWGSGTIVGCYLNAENGDVRFYVNGKELPSPTELDIKPLIAKGVCPVFSCSEDVGLSFNIGQLPFAYPPSPNPIPGLQQLAKSYFFSNSGSIPSAQSGIVLKNVSTERLKGFTIELGFRITEKDFFSPNGAVPKRCLLSAVIAGTSSTNPSFTICVDCSGAIVFETPELDAFVSAPGIIHFLTWHHLCIIWPPKVSSRKLVMLVDGVIAHSADLTESRRSHLDSSKFKLGAVCVGGRVCLLPTHSTAVDYKAIPTGGTAPLALPDDPATAPVLPADITLRFPGENPALVLASHSGAVGTSPTSIVKKNGIDLPEPPSLSISISISASSTVTSFIGDVSEVRIWSGARSVESIVRAIGRPKVSGVENNLLFQLAFEEGRGQALHNCTASCGNDRGSNVALFGAWHWAYHGSGFADEIGYERMTTPAAIISEVSRQCLAEIPAHLKDSLAFNLDDDECDTPENVADSTIDLTIQEALCCLVCKFALSTDRYLEISNTDNGMRSWHSLIQDEIPSTKSIAQPHVLNFLLLNSMLRQAIRMEWNYAPAGISPLNAKAHRIPQSLSAVLLRVVRVNFKELSCIGLSPAALGLQYSRTPDTNQKSFVARLLVTVLYLVSNEADSTSGEICEERAREAVATVISGFHIFFPDANDQIYLLICLFSKKFYDDEAFISRYVPEDISREMSQGVVRQHGTLPADPKTAIFEMSNTGDQFLLNALCENLALLKNAAKVVPIEARPLLGSAVQAAEPSTRKPGMEPLHVLSVTPRPGDIVCRGPHWQYGDNQDGGSGKFGVISEIVEWNGDFGKGLRVTWSNGSINVYRWGVVDNAVLMFDVSVLRISGDKKHAPLSEENGAATQGSPSGPRGIQIVNVDSPKFDLLYTPDEVTLSLVEDVGSLTKRTVLAYMQETAPLAWQEKHKLTWSLNTIVKEFSSESTATLYRTFFDTFSSKVPPIPTTRASKSDTVSQRDDDLHEKLELLMRMLVKEIKIQPLDKVESSPALSLALSLQVLLVGGVDLSSGGSSNQPFTVEVVALRERLFTKGFFDGAGGQLSWNWNVGMWKNALQTTELVATTHQTNNATSSEPNKSIQFLENLVLRTVPEGLVLQDDNTVEHISGRGWKTCHIGQGIQPESGIYRWYLKIQNIFQGKSRGSIVLGVCTEKFNPDAFLGQDDESWGLNSGKQLIHRGRILNNSFGHRMTVSTQIEVTLDTYNGLLYLKDARKDERREVAAAFNSGLKGKILFPAISLYNAGDCISFMSRLDCAWKSTDSLRVDVSSITSRSVPLGCPPAIVVELTLQMIEIATKIIEVPAGVELAPVSVGLVHILSSLSRWQFVPSQPSCLRRHYDAMSTLISNLAVALTMALEAEQIGSSAKSEPLASHLLKQLTCITACYMSRIVAAMLVIDPISAIDNRITTAEVKLENDRCGLANPGGNDPVTIPVLQVGQNVHTWLASKLFSQGLKTSDSSNISFGNIQEWIQDERIIWKWFEANDRFQRVERQQGGAIALVPTMRCMVALTLYHSGYLKAAMNLTQQLEHIQAETPIQLEGLKLPAFMMKAWEGALKIKAEAVKLKQSRTPGMTEYSVISHFLTARLAFLFELEPCCHELFFNFFLSSQGKEKLVQSLDEVAKSTTTQVKVVTEISDIIRSFVAHDGVFDANNLAYFRAALRNVEELTCHRELSFKYLRHTLEKLGNNFGWGAKCALLLHFPKALRNESRNLLVPLKTGRGISIAPRLSGKVIAHKGVCASKTAGHYLECLEGNSKRARREIAGAFDSLYTYLSGELSTGDVDPAVQLCLIDCLGLRIVEEDHAMISRVEVFYAIDGLLKSALSVHLQPCQALDDASTGEFARLTKAAMKLFILLTLQVASGGESSKKSSTAGAISLEAPMQSRVKSGPATLSKAVFDILFEQISISTKKLKMGINEIVGLGDCYWKDEEKPLQMPHVEVSDDDLVVISEASALLLYLASHEICQHILARPKWIGLLLELLDVSPIECQKKTLLILLVLLPVTSTDDLNREARLFTLDAQHGITVAEKIIHKLLAMCGRVFLTGDIADPFVIIRGSQLLTAFSSIALPVVSESVAILRKLMCNPQWSELVESALFASLTVQSASELFSDETLSSKVLATLFVLGGYIDSEYINCPVLVDGEESQAGIISGINEGSDVVEVVFDKSDSAEISTANLQSNVPTQSRKEISLDRLKVVNPVPAESFSVPMKLIRAALHLSDLLLFDPTLAVFIQPSAALEEEKLETIVQEEKCDAVDSAGKVQLASTWPQESQKRLFLLSTMKLACSKVLVSLSSNAKSVDRLQEALIEFSSSKPNFIRELLTSSICCTRSCGLADIDMNETYLSLALTQRRKALFSAKMSDTAKKIEAAKNARERVAVATTIEVTASDTGNENKIDALLAAAARQGQMPSYDEDPGVAALSDAGSRDTPDEIASDSIGRKNGPDMSGNGLAMSTGSVEEEEDEGQDLGVYEGEEGVGMDDNMIVENLANMGFPRRWCEIALSMTEGDTDEALAYILSNGVELDAMVSAEMRGEPHSSVGNRSHLRQYHGGDHDDGDDNDDDEDQQFDDVEAMHHELHNYGRQFGSDAPERVYHYDGRSEKLLPLYADHSSSSEMVGAVFPGETIKFLEEFVDPSNSIERWFKVDLRDFKDEESDEYDGGASNSPIFAWAQCFLNGVEVIVQGPSGDQGGLANPPAESYPFDAVYQVTLTEGIPVRSGIERSSGEIVKLPFSSTVRAVQQTINTKGTVCLRITEPVCGWISKVAGFLSQISENIAQPSMPIISEWTMLESTEDDLEVYGGNDIYRRDDRFFRSLQGGHFRRCKDILKGKIHSMHHRRLRVIGVSSHSACLQSLSTKSLDALDSIISTTTKVLTVLNCRKSFLAILLRSGRNREESSAKFSRIDPPMLVKMLLYPRGVPVLVPVANTEKEGIPASTFVKAQAIITTLKGMSFQGPFPSDASKVSNDLCSFLRLVAFRGQPFSYTGLEWLALPEVDAIASMTGKILRSLDEVLFQFVIAILRQDSTHSLNFLAGHFLQYSLLTVAHGVGQAMSTSQVEQSWDDHSYEDLTDDNSLQQANVHYCQWITTLLLELRSPDVTFVVFQAWSSGLRGTSMSFKRIVFDQLSEILTSFCHHSELASPDAQEVLRRYLALLPVERLKVMGARRLWYELEDSPSYSRYLQRLIHFLSVIEMALGHTSLPSSSVLSEEVSLSPTVTVDGADVETHAGPLLNFGSPQSYVTLTPPNDMPGSWTVEMWIYREVTPFGKETVTMLSHSPPDRNAPSACEQSMPPAETGSDRRKAVPSASSASHSGGSFGGSATSRLDATDSPRPPFRFDRPSPFASSPRVQLSAADGLLAHKPDSSPPVTPSNAVSQEVSTDSGVPISATSPSPSPAPAAAAAAAAADDHDPSPAPLNTLANAGISSIPHDKWSCGKCTSFNVLSMRRCHVCNEGVRPEIPALPQVLHEEPKSDVSAIKEEPKEMLPEPVPITIAPPFYILSSTDWHVKLQCGGRVFGLKPDDSDSSPVCEKAYCMAIGQRGGQERTFDYILPSNTWVHIAISCKASASNREREQTSLSLYVNGKLRDTTSMRFYLPLMTIGSVKRGQSFYGLMAEMRVWSYARSAGEIRRDMLIAISGKYLRHGLIVHLKCFEGTGQRIFDAAGMLQTCKLFGVDWKTSERPRLSPFPFSTFLLDESEDTHGVLGGIQSDDHVLEMTGVLKRSALVASSALSTSSQEVVSLLLQFAPGQNAVQDKSFEGYLNWCERGVRSLVQGNHNTITGAIAFTVESPNSSTCGSTFLGPPEALSWLHSLAFKGTMDEDGLKGELNLSCFADVPQALRPGQSRIDKFTIPSRCFYKRAVKGHYGPTEIISMTGDSGEFRTLSSIEAAGYDWNDRGQDKPRGTTWGLVHGDGSLWFEWSIAKSSGELAFGIMTANAFPSDDECKSRGTPLDLSKTSNPIHVNGQLFGTAWVYLITGNIMHNGQSILCEPAGDGDTVGVHLDLNMGTMAFYRNYLLLHEFHGIDAHPLVSCSSSSIEGFANDLFGLRPFFSLASGGDSVVYRGLKDGSVNIQYPESDLLGRSSLSGTLQTGWLFGKGTLRFRDKSKYIFGNWKKGLQDGVQLLIKVDLDTQAESIESANVYNEGVDVCDVSECMDDLPEVTSWRAAAIALTLTRTASGISGGGTPREVLESAPPVPASSTPATGLGPGSLQPPSVPGVSSEEPLRRLSSKDPPPAQTRSPRDVIIKIKDSSGTPTSLKMPRNVKLQRAFDVYLNRRKESGVILAKVKFCLNGEILDGECTPESLDLGENEEIEAVHDLENVFLSDAPYILKIVYREANVRNGIDIDDSQDVGLKMALGDIVEAFYRSETKEGIGRYLISEGWISERLRTPNEDKVTLVLRELASPLDPWIFIVSCESGARIRQSMSLSSLEVGFVPFGTELEVAEMRLFEPAVGGEDNLTPIKRLRVVRPVEYAGWISDKPNLVTRVVPVTKIVIDADLSKELARRAQVRLARKIAAARVESEKAGKMLEGEKKWCNAYGSLAVSSDCLFLINGKQASSNVSVSSDFKTVTVPQNSQGGRAMALGSRGFSRGTHYWEVQFESMQAGNIFIGVAPADYVQSWGGYGFVNYRVKISLTTDETMYGRWFKSGDTLGVLLDMDHGTLSFFFDTPEDLLSSNGLGKVRNMGVSHHYLRRMNNGKFPILYPCFGIKQAGDMVTIRKGKWISRKGLDSPGLFNQLMEAKSIISHWQIAYPSRFYRNRMARNDERVGVLDELGNGIDRVGECRPLPDAIVGTIYAGYHRSLTQLRQVTSRPGMKVLLDTENDAIIKACGTEFSAKFRLRTGKRFKSVQYGPGHIVGARGKQLWYVFESTDSDETGAWYWQRGELEELVSNGLISFENLLDAAAVGSSGGNVLVNTPRSPAAQDGMQPMTMSDFSACAFGSVPWTMEEDISLCAALNAFADKQGVDPIHLSWNQLEAFRDRLVVLQHRGREEIHARYAALCVLNRAVELVLPLSDLGVHQQGSNLVVRTDYEIAMRRRLLLPASVSPSEALLDIKKVIFFRTKQRFWDLVLKKTTAATSEPSDEWEKPTDLREIRLNRVVARSLFGNKDGHPFPERLRCSVFGQLMEILGSWDDSWLRRAYQHYPDAGQARAFFVKFEGEGTDDLGGPYRAVFNTIIGEECVHLLEMLVPCPNGQSNDFENRDKMLLNPRVAGGGVEGFLEDVGFSGNGGGHSRKSQAGNLYVSLGKLIGVACRHAIQVPLSLPQLVWKPLLGEAVDHADLRAIDTHTSNYLQSLCPGVGFGKGGDLSALPPEGMDEYLDDDAKDLLQSMLQQLQERLASITPAVTERLLALCSNSHPMGGGALPDGEKNLGGNVRQVCALVEHLNLMMQNECIAQVFRGLDAVLPTEIFRIFSPGELELVFCGAADLDIELLKSVTVYEGVAPFDKHIQFFWEALEQLNSEERSSFVNFCSGRSRLPTTASAFTMSFKLAKPPPASEADPDSYLPKASTCFFTLNLPQYSSAQVCLDKLRYAISNTDVMDADHLLHTGEGWGGVL